MRHFRLNFTLLLIAVAALAAAATWLYNAGLWPQATLASVAAAVCAGTLARLVWKLIDVMSTFVSALEMNDTTLQFDFGNADASLCGMARAMNRIVEMYHANLREIETGKIYYDRILRVMTHEMRNSMTPISALAFDMERNPEKYSGEQLREALGVISAQSRGIKRFLDSYHSLTHLPPPEREEIRATDFFRRIRQSAVAETTERGLPENTCRFSAGKEMRLCIDSALMGQAMINLVRNALDAVQSTERPEVTVTASVSDGRPYITVADNGCGMDARIRDSLFQPFVTTKPGGSGVGLCLSSQIVRLHGGTLRLLSTSPSGTTFAITLP